MAKTIELYNLLKGKIGEEESKVLVETINEVSDKAKQEAATKADLENVRIELKGDIKSLRLEMKLFFITLIFLMLLTNPKALDLIAKIAGLVK